MKNYLLAFGLMLISTSSFAARFGNIELSPAKLNTVLDQQIRAQYGAKYGVAVESISEEPSNLRGASLYSVDLRYIGNVLYKCSLVIATTDQGVVGSVSGCQSEQGEKLSIQPGTFALSAIAE